MTPPPPRPLEQRIADTRARLGADEDLWVATGAASGPYLVPLSYDWDGESFVVSTLPGSVTARNIAENGTVRLALGPTRDVVMVDATARLLTADEVADGVADSYVARNQWDPRKEPEEYAWFRFTPQRVQAWREANELRGRDLMKQGSWLA